MVWTEELGFDQIGSPSTIHRLRLSVDPASLAATAAARTSRVRIGLAAAILPFHHPLRLAEQVALIDIISKGRLDVGVGRGNRPAEFQGYHVPQQENRERFDEAVDIMLRAWTEERFSHDGRFFTIGETRVIPKPWQRPHPPIYQVCGSDDGIESSAARGWPMLNSLLTGPMDQLVKRRDSYLTALRKHGRTEPEIAALMKNWGVSRQIYVAATDAQALAEAKDAEMWYQDSLRRFQVPERIEDVHPSLQPGFRAAAERFKKVTWEGLVAETVAFGSPDTVAPHPGHARHGHRPRALLDELRRAAPGQDPPVHGAVRPRGHAALPRRVAFNTAARLEEYAKRAGLDLVVSDALLRRLELPPGVLARRCGELELRGKEAPVAAYRLSG
jgi:alkanesulfonate monooxygenase SsuD/methylene tetrahydromethanopterin reductase-like flavin-dependent oxidoreductase (luciferase family)